jgi:hypothetical protein
MCGLWYLTTQYDLLVCVQKFEGCVIGTVRKEPQITSELHEANLRSTEISVFSGLTYIFQGILSTATCKEDIILLSTNSGTNTLPPVGQLFHYANRIVTFATKTFCNTR